MLGKLNLGVSLKIFKGLSITCRPIWSLKSCYAKVIFVLANITAWLHFMCVCVSKTTLLRLDFLNTSVMLLKRWAYFIWRVQLEFRPSKSFSRSSYFWQILTSLVITVFCFGICTLFFERRSHLLPHENKVEIRREEIKVVFQKPRKEK